MNLSDATLHKLRPIRLLALDVDGVLTDGSLYFSENGLETKAFNSQDGQGLKLLQASGITLAIITGRSSQLVQQRATSLGIEHVQQGREDKLTALTELAAQLGYAWQQIAYCGDDLPDLGAIRKAGFGATVANAPDYIKQYSDYVCQRSGGQGAVREITDLIMQAQGTWSSCLDYFLHRR